MNHCWNQWLSCDPCHEIWPKSVSSIRFQLIEVMICFYIFIFLCNITWNGVVPLHPHELCTGAQNYASGSSTVGRLSADFRGSSWFAVRRANLWKCFAPISNIKNVTVNIGSKHIILGVSKVARRGWIPTSILYIHSIYIYVYVYTLTHQLFALDKMNPRIHGLQETASAKASFDRYAVRTEVAFLDVARAQGPGMRVRIACFRWMKQVETTGPCADCAGLLSTDSPARLRQLFHPSCQLAEGSIPLKYLKCVGIRAVSGSKGGAQYTGVLNNS